MTTANDRYIFDNADVQRTTTRFTALPQMFDPATIRHLETLGVGPGWSCLEVGAGGGTIARWLGERVGPAGKVVATDIDIRFLEDIATPPIEVRRHDITTDPLPDGAFDLVHTRLVLSHLPERERGLERMIASLKPGGWLLVEEFDVLSMPPDASINPAEARLPLARAMHEMMTDRGVDLRLGRLLPSQFRAKGLREIDAEGRVLLWQGGSLGNELMRSNFEQIREGLMARLNLTDADFEHELSRLDDPEVMNPSPVLWSVWGRRAA